MAPIMTGAQLADLLRSYSATALAREADVALQTIYNLRDQRHAPTLTTLRALMAAVERLRLEKKA